MMSLAHLLTGLLLLFVGHLHAQQPRAAGTPKEPTVMMPLRPWEHGITHPTQLALEEWERLRLTPDQVRHIRQIEERTSSGFEPLIEAQTRGAMAPSVWWNQEKVDEAALRAGFRRTADMEATILLRLLQARDEVYAVLNPEQRAQLQDL